MTILALTLMVDWINHAATRGNVSVTYANARMQRTKLTIALVIRILILNCFLSKFSHYCDQSRDVKGVKILESFWEIPHFQPNQPPILLNKIVCFSVMFLGSAQFFANGQSTCKCLVSLLPTLFWIFWHPWFSPLPVFNSDLFLCPNCRTWAIQMHRWQWRHWD